MPYAAPAWIREDITKTVGCGEWGGAIETDGPFRCTMPPGWPPLNCWLTFANTLIVPDTIWGEGGAVAAPIWREPVLAIYVSDIGCNFAPDSRPNIWLKTHANPINPADGTALWNLWNTGISLIEVQLEGQGWHFITLRDCAVTQLEQVRDNGIMIGANENGYVFGDRGSALFTKIRLFSHFGFAYPSSLILPNNSYLNRQQIDQSVIDIMKKASPDTNFIVEGEIGLEVRDRGNNLTLTEKNISITDIFAKQEFDYKEPWTLQKTEVTAFLFGRQFAGNVSLLEDLLETPISISLYIIVRGTKTLIYRMGGIIKNTDILPEGIKISIANAITTGLEYQVYNEITLTGNRVVGVAEDTDVIYDIAFPDRQIETLFAALMNMRHGARLQDIYVNDWIYLDKRFCSVFEYMRLSGHSAIWTGKTIGDLAETIATEYGLFTGITQQGNFLVWHPAVYRPSMRIHELNIDAECSDIKVSRPSSDYYQIARLSGEGNSGEIDEQISLFLDMAAYTTGDAYEVSPLDGDGHIPYSRASDWFFRRPLLKQHVSRATGSVRMIEAEINNAGFLYELGDQVKVSSDIFDMDEDVYMVYSVEPSLDSPTKISLLRWEDNEAMHCLFEESAPHTIIRSSDGVNQTWGAGVANFATIGTVNSIQSSWQGQLLYSNSGGYLQGAATLANNERDIYEIEYGGGDVINDTGAYYPIFRLRHTADNSAFVILIKNEVGGPCDFQNLKMYAGWCPNEAFIDDPTTYVDLITFATDVGTGEDSGSDGGYIGAITLEIPMSTSPHPPVNVYKNRQLVGVSSLGHAKNDAGWDFVEIQGWGDTAPGYGVCAGVFALFGTQEAGILEYPDNRFLPESGYDIYYP